MIRDEELSAEKREHLLDLVVRSHQRIDDLMEALGTLAVEESAAAGTRWTSLESSIELVCEEIRNSVVLEALEAAR